MKTLLAVAMVHAAVLRAQAPGAGEPILDTGRDIFRAACSTCHGVDGKGSPQSSVAFDTPIPDFTDCSLTAREPDSDWVSIIHNGGPVRGFSQIMPSFHEALKAGQILKVVDYLRSLCRDAAWPRGDLNFPRALVTEKAFVEDEAVLTTAINSQQAGGVTNTFVYEKRIGAKANFEAVVPFTFQHPSNSTWRGGIGDIILEYKRVLFSTLRTGTILSVGGELILPTGDSARGLGSGVTKVEPYLSFGQRLGSGGFVQLQTGIEAPTHGKDAFKESILRTVVGRSFMQGMGFGRAWTPMMEVVGVKEHGPGLKAEWDVLPQFQVTLSKRQHIMANFGVRVPVSNTAGRPVRIVFYLLWDWFDGGLRQGW